MTSQFMQQRLKLVPQAMGRAPRSSGIAIEGIPPILIFRLPTGINAEGQELLALYGQRVDGWIARTLPFGSALQVTIQLPTAMGASTRRKTSVLINKRDPAFLALKQATFQVVMVKNNRVLLTAMVDAPPGAALADFQAAWMQVQLNKPALFDDEAVLWYSAGTMVDDGALSPEEGLQNGWAINYQERTQRLGNLMNQCCRSDRLFEAIEAAPVVSEIKQLFEIIRTADLDIQRVLDFFRTVEASGRDALLSLVHSSQVLLDALPEDPTSDQLSGGILAYRTMMSAVFSYLEGPRITRHGKCVPYVTEDRVFRLINLEPAKFPKTYESRSYWLHLPACLHYFWDRFITGRDVPVDLSRDSEVWKSFPLPENLDETRKASADLLAEASTGKVASIPPGAIVQIPFGPFAYCEVHEVKSDVFFVFRTPERRFAVLWIGAYHDVFYFPQIHSADPEQFNLEGIYASAKLVMAAIIRDFWVVEEREIVFAAREAREHEFRFRHDKQQEPRVVYLPRIKYVQKPNVAACAKELNHPQRREHFVRPFLRRAGHASEDQRFLAAEYGFSVPTGFTFVRPHKRGGQPRDIVYRSRSALRSLYEAHDAGGTSTGPVRWFQFERDVSVLLKSIGFDVEHVGASRNGDHGIDVLATKGDDLEKVTWLIQCKCYHPTREVDPDKVRSLLGALQDAPPNCRGMLVTTSYFGPEARRLADSHGIRLMDGEEFSRRVLGSRPKRPS